MRGALEPGRYEFIDRTVENPALNGECLLQTGKVTHGASIVAQGSVSTALICCQLLVSRGNA